MRCFFCKLNNRVFGKIQACFYLVFPRFVTSYNVIESTEDGLYRLPPTEPLFLLSPTTKHFRFHNRNIIQNVNVIQKFVANIRDVNGTFLSASEQMKIMWKTWAGNLQEKIGKFNKIKRERKKVESCRRLLMPTLKIAFVCCCCWMHEDVFVSHKQHNRREVEFIESYFLAQALLFTNSSGPCGWFCSQWNWNFIRLVVLTSRRIVEREIKEPARKKLLNFSRKRINLGFFWV